MKWLFLFAVSLVAALFLIRPAEADCYGRSRVVYQQSYSYTPAYVAPTYSYSAFVAVPIPVYPVFGAAYDPGTAAEIKALRSEILGLRQRLEGGVQQPQTMPPVPPDRPGNGGGAKVYQNAQLLAVAKASCAECHTAGKLKNNQLALLAADGASLAPLTREQAQEAALRVVASEMPPKDSSAPKVKDEEVALFFALSKALKGK